MFRHVVMMRWKAGTPASAVAEITDALRHLHAAWPSLVDYRYGPDLGVQDGSWDYVVVADFANVDDYREFRDDPDHQAMISRLIAPHRADRAAVQFDW